MAKKRHIRRKSSGKARRQPSAYTRIFVSNNSEESKDYVDLIGSIAASAGKAAYSEANAIGLPRIYATPNHIIVQQKDGSQAIISSADQEQHSPYFKKFEFHP